MLNIKSALLKKADQDPSLLVSGYGVLKESQIKAKVEYYLKEYMELAKKENWSGLYYYNRNGVLDAMVKTLADYADHKIQPYPVAKLDATDAAAQEGFKQSRRVDAQGAVKALVAAALSKPGKTAKPEVLDQSLLYLKIEADPQDPNFFNVSFFSPKLRSQAVPGGGSFTYRVEVGDKGGSQIRRDLNKLVVPQMRDDILESDHALLEKVVYRLKNAVLEAATEYMGLGEAQKAQYKNVIRMDIYKYQDVMVKMHDNKNLDETLEA